MSKIGEISGVEVYLSPQQYEEYKNSLEDEIERLNNIIREVREYIEKDYIYIQHDAYNKLLEILNEGE